MWRMPETLEATRMYRLFQRWSIAMHDSRTSSKARVFSKSDPRPRSDVMTMRITLDLAFTNVRRGLVRMWVYFVSVNFRRVALLMTHLAGLRVCTLFRIMKGPFETRVSVLECRLASSLSLRFLGFATQSWCTLERLIPMSPGVDVSVLCIFKNHAPK